MSKVPFRQRVGSPRASTTAAGLMSAAQVSQLAAISSGTYTPTGTAVVNLDSVTPGVWQYIKVGSYVIMWGTVTIDPTASGSITARISLSVVSNFAANSDADGIVNTGGGYVYADTTNDALYLVVPNNSASTAYSVFVIAGHKVI